MLLLLLLLVLLLVLLFWLLLYKLRSTNLMRSVRFAHSSGWRDLRIVRSDALSSVVACSPPIVQATSSW